MTVLMIPRSEITVAFQSFIERPIKIAQLHFRTWYPTASSLRGVMANVLDCGHSACEFEPHLRYYVLFQTNTLVGITNSFHQWI